MKHGKKPTRGQKQFLKSKGLNFRNWLVCKDEPGQMVVEHRHTNTYKIIRKEVN